MVNNLNVLQRALLIVACDEVEKYKALPEQSPQFSQEFEREIENINRKRKSFFTQITKTVPRKIAVVLIAAVISLCLMMSISAIRVPIVNFFVNFYEDHISIHFQTNEEQSPPTSIQCIYMPTYMAEGYSLFDTQRNEIIAEAYWQGDEYMIYLWQEVISDSLSVLLDTEYSTYESFTIDSNDIYYTLEKGEYMFIWEKHGYLFTMVMPGNISLSEAKQIIESIEETN
ncbi:MAG: DUF4367 domain-containing protein [Clostridia bacterium]|nr:DUF4367 domain-containing protein [Clostridia bacterium]